MARVNCARPLDIVKRLFVSIACLLSLVAAQGAVSRKPPPHAPNIIFILADDLGYGELGCYGQKKIKTPNIDRLAAEGMRFTQCYAGTTVCAPSRSVPDDGPAYRPHAHSRQQCVSVAGRRRDSRGGLEESRLQHRADRQMGTWPGTPRARRANKASTISSAFSARLQRTIIIRRTSGGTISIVLLEANAADKKRAYTFTISSRARRQTSCA